MKKRYKIILISFMVLLLAAIRFFEDSLFYDPLIAFFRSDYLLGIIPPMNMAELMIHLSIRYALNSAISLGIIYIAFQNRSMLKFSVILYALLYLGAVSAFIFLVLNIEREHYLALFYIRRFLIHPLFLLILLPAFYYYRISKKEI
ncbi:exosortase F system-associated protein [uncultured Christiangramia sp.]|uniref:exosortase F system-associated membrane protein n=1 Tax=uncultured Christiangramia sp. TaxID=503836 RepID=UPI0025FFC931|nr:exosortase F system-associated protein [uncultured Christiangramia sp.]|tara:strand:+ start:36 stop:473 length:438 start_codon:yes stop_codon:yes gene_type:complete